MAPTMSILAVVAASLPSGRIVFGPEWKAGLVDFHQADNGLRSGSTMLARSLWASSQALR